VVIRNVPTLSNDCNCFRENKNFWFALFTCVDFKKSAQFCEIDIIGNILERVFLGESTRETATDTPLRERGC